MAAFCLVLAACASKTLSPDKLISYIQDEDNGLHQSITVNGVAITVQYRPTDLWVYQDIGYNAVTNALIDSLRRKYNHYYYFILSLSRNDEEALSAPGVRDQYSDLVQTMSFRMVKYVTLTTSTDSIPVADFMLNRTYGLNTSTDVLFVFSKEKAAGQEWVQFNLNEFGLGTGNQRFRFRRENLEGAPKISFAVE